jgi:MtN3 and saliva related transmembrane protein
MIEPVTIIGAVAAIASTASFLPQAVKIIRTRDTSSISTGMYAVTVTGFALWTTYGIMLGKWPLIASNSISLLLSAFILLMTLVSPRDREKIVRTIAPGEAHKRKRRKPTGS